MRCVLQSRNAKGLIRLNVPIEADGGYDLRRKLDAELTGLGWKPGSRLRPALDFEGCCGFMAIFCDADALLALGADFRGITMRPLG